MPFSADQPLLTLQKLKKSFGQDFSCGVAEPCSNYLMGVG
jgi:hypothetical protein